MVAEIVPTERTMTASQTLAGLVSPRLALNQAADWLKDSKEYFNQTVRDPWA